MTAVQRFLNGLNAIKTEFNAEIEELIAYAEVMARKQNSVDLDEQGFFYVTATGPLEEVIPTMEKQLQKLERIRAQKNAM